jgi:hypothetical protein
MYQILRFARGARYRQIVAHIDTLGDAIPKLRELYGNACVIYFEHDTTDDAADALIKPEPNGTVDLFAIERRDVLESVNHKKTMAK